MTEPRPLWGLAALLLAACGDVDEAPATGSSGEALGAELEALSLRVEALEAEVETLSGLVSGEAGRCPEDMVAVGALCVDRWKASVTSEPACEGTRYGEASDDYPEDFDDSGDGDLALHACSAEGVLPAGHLTWFQAAAACAHAGKRLCTNAEWQVAVQGTPWEAEACNLASGEVLPTGSHPGCVSAWGAVDMVGSRWEWVADWVPGGSTWLPEDIEDEGEARPWPEGYGDGQDYTLNINGSGYDTEAVSGLPSAVIRGGDYGNGAEAGNFAVSWARAPSHAERFVGFRCCRAPGPQGL